MINQHHKKQTHNVLVLKFLFSGARKIGSTDENVHTRRPSSMGSEKEFCISRGKPAKMYKKDGLLTCCHVLGIECHRHDRVKQMYPIPA